MSSSNDRRSIRVAVIGAGIGGLTAAVALRQKGFEVDVYEKATRLAEVGAGLQVGPNAVRVIDALGLGPAFRKLAAEPTVRLSLRWDTGEVRVREEFQGRMVAMHGSPYLMAHRADLHGLLLGQMPAAHVHTDAACTGVETRPDGARATFADGRTIDADVIVGADGIHSVVRSALFGPSTPRFTQQICWRVILPMEALAAASGELPVPLTGQEYTGWLGPTGHVLFYPLRGGKLLNIFAGRVSSTWAEESWAVPSSVPEMLEAYAGWNPGMLAVLGQATEAYRWGVHDRDPLERWTSGRIALLGDAAHPMMPTLAQGAAISMEDGYALARHLAMQPDDPGTALACYEEERRPRASKVQLQARQQFLNNQLVPPPPPLPVDWIYGHDAVTGPQTILT